ncbi:MAG TPA: G/U mismatch-specific DNA glycosylase [Gemmataceae bacterium]|nr:G/U mismatch-specific DNA glycosylase [Gemmataceae bacterium]
MQLYRRPTRAEIAAAVGKTVPDVIGPNLRLLFCGINPGLYTAVIGHHFGRPGNRFWPALYAGGFTDRLLSPYEEHELLPRGYGITNIVARASVRADELTEDELRQGARILERKVRRYRPRFVAFLGITAYRTAFQRPNAVLGLQPETLAEAKMWLLPSPSGLNAHHSPASLARLFGELRQAVVGDDV